MQLTQKETSLLKDLKTQEKPVSYTHLIDIMKHYFIGDIAEINIKQPHIPHKAGICDRAVMMRKMCIRDRLY